MNTSAIAIFPPSNTTRATVQWRDVRDGLLHERSFYTLDLAKEFALRLEEA